MNYSLHMARKYARIFVHGHYLFLEVHSTLSENYSLFEKFVNLKVASLRHF